MKYTNDWFKQALDSMKDLVLIKGPKSKLLWANKAFLDYYGMTQEQLYDIVDGPQSDPDDTLQYVRDDQRVFDTQKVLNIPSEVVTNADGVARNFHTIKSPIFENEKIIKTIGISRLIEESESDSILTSSHLDAKKYTAPLRSLVNSFPTPMILIDVKKRISSLSSLWRENFGDIHDSPNIFFEEHYKDLGELIPLIEKSINEDTIQNCTIEYKAKETTKHFNFLLKPWLYQDGSIGGVTIIASDITELKENEKILEKAKEAAEASSQSKADFLANMSHEIRTPMNGILGMVSLLVDTKLEDEQQEMLTTVRSCGDSLLTILNDILDFSKIESGKLELELINFNIVNCISETLSLFAFQAKNKNISMKYSLSSDIPPFLFGDLTRIRQVLANLLSNAIKFTTTGEVSIDVTSIKNKNEELEITFCISDTGIGISSVNQEKLFQAFSQADNSTTRKFGGTGLGLSICSRLAEVMGGEIRLTSKEGIGSKFYFRLPLAKGSETTENFEIFDVEEKASKLKQISILVAEDNNINQKLMTSFLSKIGYTCDIAANGKEVLELLELKKYDLIFMDIQMPEMDGITATLEIVKKYKEDRPRIIAMTANVFKEDRDKCIESGMNGFIPKPIQFSEVKKSIELIKKN